MTKQELNRKIKRGYTFHQSFRDEEDRAKKTVYALRKKGYKAFLYNSLGTFIVYSKKV